MYCLEKLQRELAYYFSKDIRELPKVESLLAEAGYTQIRKGDEIIEIDSTLRRYSADLGDSSVETKELLHTKTTSKLTKDELDNLPIATAQEYGEFLEKIAQKDYQNTPEILKIATLNRDLQELINNNHSASVFITRARAGHISEVRKGEYDQALTLEEQKQIPAEIAQAKQAYTDDKSGFILPFADKNNSEKINLIILDSDSKGNFLITAKKVNSAELNNPKYKKLARAGVEPATTTPPKAEQKPTEAISLARDEIIPQSTQEKPKWSRSDSKKWKLDKLEQTKAAARKLYEQLQPIYNQARPLLIKAKELKSKSKAQELKDKAWKLIEQESKPFIKELEQHALELDRTAFTLYPESASIKIQPKSNFDLEWKNKKRGAQGLKGAAKYRAQALQRLSEKDYMTPFEQATKASNPLTSLHALKFEILKDLHKAKVYINQQGYDKDLHKTYLGYVNRASSELDSVDQSIRELKSKIQPKPQRVQEVRSKVQDLIKWRDEVRFDTDYLLALKSDGVRHALEYLEAKLQAATLPQQASFINQLKEQIKEHFPTPPTPPHTPKVETSVESQAEQKSLFDTPKLESHAQKVETSELNFTYTTGEAKSIGQLRKDLKAALEPYKSTPIINKETGLQGVVTTDEINKIASKKAVDKSIVNGFSRDEHFAAAQDLKNLFENATKAQSHNDYKQRENIAQVHRFIQDLYINDKPAQAKITLFEKIEGKNRIYTLELESLNKPDPLNASVPNTESAAKAQSVATARTETTTIAKTDGTIIPQATHQDYNTFNQSLKDAHDFFKANNKDPYNDKLFNDVIKVANALDIRFWYQPNAVWMGGSYTYTLNRIMLRSKDFSAENAQTMLHELIHSVTSRAIYAYENKALRAKLSKEQIEAITELKNLYKEVSENNADKVWKKMATFRDEVENNKGKLYGLKNEHEMLAELANPTFREFLKEQNIFSKIVEAMAKIFSYVKDKLTGESVKSTNAQSELESILYKIMDSYTNPHAFTNEMSEHFGSRNFVDTTRYKEYIKDHKEKFDKDNYKGKHLFSFFDDSMNFYTKSALGGRENFFKTYINNAYFDEKDFDIVQKLKWQMMDPVKRPTNFMDLKTEKNAHIFEYIAQAQENNIKDFVKEYYGVSYDEFNNAFNGAMKDKHFYEAKPFTYKNYEDIPSKETAFLLALKPYFTSGLYKTLSEADFNVIKDNLYRILQDENLTYRNKPINEWLAKEWVEQDVKALQESFLYKLEQPPLQATQNALESTMKKFNYDEKKAKDLLEWHKDSSPLTKDENGVPKVFYHGTKWREIGNKIFEVFDTKYSNQVDKFLQGHYFSSSKKIARTYDANNIYKVFLNAKNPLVIDFKGHTFNNYIDEAINNIPKSVQENIRDFYDSIIFKNIIDDNTQNGKKHPVADTIMVLDSNQIKHIENRGIESEQAQKYFNESSPNIFHSNPHAGAGLLGGSVAGIETDENGNITFNPEKFALGLLGGAGASIGISKTIKRASGKYAIMSRMEAKKHNKKLYNVFKAIDSSAKYGSKMNLIGKENLNADTLAYALARNKRFAINKLDEKTAKEMGFKYPHDVRRSIDPNNVAHTLNRHGEQSNLVQFSGQKPVTLDEIAKYQDYADNATHKGISIGKRQETANISARQLDGEFYVVVEQIQKGQNELGFKTMYFERGILDDEKFNKLLKK